MAQTRKTRILQALIAIPIGLAFMLNLWIIVFHILER